MEDNYKNDFEKFISHTDEKKVLVEEISKEIDKYSVESLLDIGAGNGSLSIPLSKKVRRYLAVEPNENFVSRLREAGLEVVGNKFPSIISDTFDMALSSHSISYKRDSFKPFITKAWKLVKPRGVFLIITFRGQEDDWTRLMKDLGENHEDKNRVGFNQIIEILSSIGKVKTRKVITQLKTDNLEDMMQALSFVASGGKPEKKESFMKNRSRLEKTLNLKYRKNNDYSFPFQHFFIMTKKI